MYMLRTIGFQRRKSDLVIGQIIGHRSKGLRGLLGKQEGVRRMDVILGGVLFLSRDFWRYPGRYRFKPRASKPPALLSSRSSFGVGPPSLCVLSFIGTFEFVYTLLQNLPSLLGADV
jgi:hypothetical protein